MSNLDAEARLRRKIGLRLVAPLTFLIFLSSVDRSNIALAALTMNREIGLTPVTYGLGSTLYFFAGYILLQYPHTASLRVLGPRRWVTLAVTLWGLVAASTAFVHTPIQFYVVRFILGALEGGYAAGATALAALWMPRKYRAVSVTTTMLAVPLSQVFGSPLSGFLMTAPLTLFGLSGWRLMVLMEGSLTVVIGLLCWFLFVDRVEAAPWLDDGERDLVAAELAQDAAERPATAGASRLSFLTQPRMWGVIAIWFCLLTGALGIMFWMAQVVKQVAGGDPLRVGIISAMPWVGVGLGMYFNARHSDKTGERYLHLAGAAGFGAVCLVAAFLVPPGWASILLLVLGGAGLGGAQGVFWPIPLSMVSRDATAAAVTIIAMAGNLAGLVVTPLIGVLRERTGQFGAPIYMLAGMLALAAVLVLAVRPRGAAL